MEHWFSQFRYGNPNDQDFQKRLVDTFVNSVYVYDDKLVLTYNYQHGTQTITLKEVEDFLGSDLVGLSPRSRNLVNTPFCWENGGFARFFMRLSRTPERDSGT